jgi:hypothetical protein
MRSIPLSRSTGSGGWEISRISGVLGATLLLGAVVSDRHAEFVVLEVAPVAEAKLRMLVEQLSFGEISPGSDPEAVLHSVTAEVSEVGSL